MDPDEIYDDTEVPENENVEPKKRRRRRFHSSEYVSKKRKESYAKCVEKKIRENE